VDTNWIFYTEPTTGLDSSQAKKVFDIIAKTARDRNIPCLCTIHQPRASIWKELDSFILMAPGGRIVYMGDRKKAVSYFSKLDYHCPPETTPAEFFIDLVTIDTEDPDVAKQDVERIDKLSSAFKEQQQAILSRHGREWQIPKGDNVSMKHRMRPMRSRLAALLLRSIRQNFRDVRVNCLRSVASLGLARLFCELFSGVKKGKSAAKSVADRTALLSFGVINMTMMAMMKTLNLFGKEKGVVSREQMRRHYTSFDYLISKTLAELPLDILFSSMFAAALKHFTCLTIPFSKLCGTFSLLTVSSASLGFAVGSFTNGVEEAMTVGMPMMVIFMAVGIINPSGVDASAQIPWLIRILKRLSPIGMAIEGLCVAEYKGMKFNDGGKRWGLKELPRMGGLALVQNGDQVLEALALQTKTYSGIMQDLATLSALNLLMSWVGLSFFGSNSNYVQASGKSAMRDELDQSNVEKTPRAQTSSGDPSKVNAPVSSLRRWFY